MISSDNFLDLNEMIAFWQTAKLLSPLLLALSGGMASLLLYYVREISKSLKNVGTSLIKLEIKVQHHSEEIEYQGGRIDRIEDHCPVARSASK